MLGAIAGDVCGSIYERDNLKTDQPDAIPLFDKRSRFTDDTVLTVATAEACLGGGDFAAAYKSWGRRYPDAGYGKGFRAWMLSDDTKPYGSQGNGSAMRVSPVGWLFASFDATMAEAERGAAATHNHPEGIKGAQAVAAAIYWARAGCGKDAIRDGVQSRFGYDLDRRIDDIRPGYRFDATCPGSVPEAILAFLESRDVADAIRLGISLGGDSDTIACVAGAIAEAFYGGVPGDLAGFARGKLAPDMLAVLERFEAAKKQPPARERR